MEETYLFYSSLTLFAMGCLALALSIFFYLKFYTLKSLPENLSANVFNKTFVVFNPYSGHRRIIYNLILILVLPFIISIVYFWLAPLIMFKIFEFGFILSLFIVIVALNLIAVEGALETYQNSRTFIKAVQGGSNLGVGDVKAFQVVKNTMPRLVKYYLGLSIVFMVLSAALPYIWSSLLGSFTQLVGSILEISALTGGLGFLVAGLLFALVLVFVSVFAVKIKNKLLTI